MNEVLGDWLFVTVFVGLLVFMMSLVNWQQKRLLRFEWRELHLMDLWMYLTMLQSITKDDAELGKQLRELILEGGKNGSLREYVEQQIQKRKEENR